jgi:hypothetical protein
MGRSEAVGPAWVGRGSAGGARGAGWFAAWGPVRRTQALLERGRRAAASLLADDRPPVPEHGEASREWWLERRDGRERLL